MSGAKDSMAEEKMQSAGSKRRGDDPLGSNSEIGRKLREYYDGLMTPDVPDRFTDLLSKLEQAEASRKPGGENE